MFFTLGGAFLWWIIDLVRIGYPLQIKLLKKRKAKAKAIAAKAEAEAKAKAIAAGYNSMSNKITIGMLKNYVEELKGSGYDTKRKTSRDGESITVKYGKYFKKLSNGSLSSTPSFKMEVEYERADDGNPWLVCSFRDF